MTNARSAFRPMFGRSSTFTSGVLAEHGISNGDASSVLRRLSIAREAKSNFDGQPNLEDRGACFKHAATYLRSASAAPGALLLGPSMVFIFPSTLNWKRALQPFRGKLLRTCPKIRTTLLRRGAVRDWPPDATATAAVDDRLAMLVARKEVGTSYSEPKTQITRKKHRSETSQPTIDLSDLSILIHSDSICSATCLGAVW